MSSESAADIVFIHEILQSPRNFDNKFVRITGFIASLHDYSQFYRRGCKITYKNASMDVDCELVDMNLFSVESLYQFFGHIRLHEVLKTYMSDNR